MDADEKVKKRVHWLNTTGGFNNGLSLEKVMSAAFGLEVTVVMKVLKDLEEKRDTVKDPTAYVTAALRKVGGGQGFVDWGAGGGAAPAASWTSSDAAAEDEKLRKKIGWMNHNGWDGLINYSKIFEAAKGLEYSEVFFVLKQLEDKNRGTINDPTAWVCSALRKAGGGNRGGGGGSAGNGSGLQMTMAMPSMPPPVPAAYPPPAYGGYDPGQMMPMTTPADWNNGTSAEAEDKEVRRKIGWLNKDGGFNGSVNYSKIIEAAKGLEYRKVMQFLKNLEGKASEVKDPTAWVCTALRKAGGGGGAWGSGSMPPPSPYTSYSDPFFNLSQSTPAGGQGPQPVDADEKLRKRVMWLNTQGGFEGALDHEKVASAAWGLEVTSVMKVLKDAEEKKDQLKDALAYVTSALRKMGGGSKGGGGGGAADYGSTDGGSAAPMDVDADQKLRRRIGWLNKEGGFDNAINYMKVAEAAAGVDIASVMEVLKDLEANRGKVKDPTAYTTAALRKRGLGGNGVRRTIMKNKH